MALKYVLVVAGDREYWLRAKDFETTDPGSDGTFTVDLYGERNRRVGQFAGVTGVYISAVPDMSMTNHVPEFFPSVEGHNGSGSLD